MNSTGIIIFFIFIVLLLSTFIIIGAIDPTMIK